MREPFDEQTVAHSLYALMHNRNEAIDRKPPKAIAQAIGTALAIAEFEDALSAEADFHADEDLLHLDIAGRLFMIRVHQNHRSGQFRFPDSTREAEHTTQLMTRAATAGCQPLVVLVFMDLIYQPLRSGIDFRPNWPATMTLHLEGYPRGVTGFPADEWLERISEKSTGGKLKAAAKPIASSSSITVNLDEGDCIPDLLSRERR